MDRKGKAFNSCPICGGRLMVVITRRYDQCRIRTYECRCCHNRRKSVESFKESKGERA